MPRKSVNYSKTIIYKIVCKDLSIKDLYIGSTTDFTTRKCGHKHDCNNDKRKHYNFKVYQMIRENGGWDNWEMLEIEKYPCNNNNEARTRERFWYEELHASMNTLRPIVSVEEIKEEVKEHKKEYRSRPEVKEHIKEYNSRPEVKEHKKEYVKEYGKEYRGKNKTKINIRMKDYYEKKKNEINERRKEKTICSCGLEIRKDSLKRHERTKKHIEYVQSLNSLN